MPEKRLVISEISRKKREKSKYNEKSRDLLKSRHIVRNPQRTTYIDIYRHIPTNIDIVPEILSQKPKKSTNTNPKRHRYQVYIIHIQSIPHDLIGDFKTPAWANLEGFSF